LSQANRLDEGAVGAVPVKAGFVTAVKIPRVDVGQAMVDVVNVALSE
jgi:hypothetical protein